MLLELESLTLMGVDQQWQSELCRSTGTNYYWCNASSGDTSRMASLELHLHSTTQFPRHNRGHFRQAVRMYHVQWCDHQVSPQQAFPCHSMRMDRRSDLGNAANSFLRTNVLMVEMLGSQAMDAFGGSSIVALPLWRKIDCQHNSRASSSYTLTAQVISLLVQLQAQQSMLLVLAL